MGDVLGRPFAANLGDIEGAKRNYQSAATLLEGVRTRGKEDAARLIALGDVYEKLARIANRKGLMPKAIEDAEKSVHARERAAALDPSIESRLALVNGDLLLALCHSDFGKASQNAGELRLAQHIIDRALEDAKRWSQEDPVNDNLHLLVAKAAEYLFYADSDLAAVTGEPQDQTKLLRLAELQLAEFKPLYAREPFRYRRFWADGLLDLSRALWAIGDGAGAERAARQGLGLFEEIADSDPNNYEAARDVMLAHFLTAKAVAAQHKDASSEFHTLLAGYEKLHPRNPGDQPTGLIAESRDWLAAHALAAGDRSAALLLYRKNISLLETASNVADLMQLAREDEPLGDTLAQDAPKAKECYIRAAEIWRKFPQQQFTVQRGAEIARKLTAIK